MIFREAMHITHLCNTALDNPTARTPEQRAEELMQYFITDTVRLLSQLSTFF